MNLRDLEITSKVRPEENKRIVWEIDLNSKIEIYQKSNKIN